MNRRPHPFARRDQPARYVHGELLDWRVRRLLAAGFTPTLALELSGDRDIDLHALLELTDRGCPPELAARILAPL